MLHEDGGGFTAMFAKEGSRIVGGVAAFANKPKPEEERAVFQVR
jgi:hypothetical protein